MCFYFSSFFFLQFRTMKPSIKPKKPQCDTVAYAIEHSSLDIPSHCPTFHQLVDVGEVNLLDLPLLQVDIERLLASATQRMTCMSCHLHGLPIPTSVLRNLGLMDPDPNNQPTHPCEMLTDDTETSMRKADEESLVVTANPNKPLSLIFSSHRKQQQQMHRTCDGMESLGVKNKAKDIPKTSTSSTPSPAVHDIPNRFWALMEPYCADISEANISYLEGILKSYVEEATTSKYFLLPQSQFLDDTSGAAQVHHSSGQPVHPPKRLRRDISKLDKNSFDAEEINPNQDQLSEANKAALEMVSLARHIDGQLRIVKPSSSSSVEHLLCSLESDLYEDNVSSVLRNAVAHIVQDGKNGVLQPPPPLTIHQENSSLISLTPNSKLKLTTCCSQPLKNLACNLQVSSSFRVEKKISQATEELGLFPLTLYLNHLSHRPEKPLLKLAEFTLNTDPISVTPDAVNSDLLVRKSPVVNGVSHSPKENSSPSSPQLNFRNSHNSHGSNDHKSFDFQSNGFASSGNEDENGDDAVSEQSNGTGARNDESSNNLEEETGNVLDGNDALLPHPVACSLSSDSATTSSPTQSDAKKLLSILMAGNRSEETSSLPTNQNSDHLDDRASDRQCSPSPVKFDELPKPSHRTLCNGSIEDNLFPASLPQFDDDDDDLSNCLLNLTAANSTDGDGTDHLSLALMRRQRELRLVCAANHNILHRLIQAARRDLQRQEIQRRLAIADADVIEAYNKLESYKAQKRSALKRDRDFAWKTLKEREKIRAELNAFDKKPP
uniref:PDZ domain-containing protein n=1 Tax=Mesocestoides corti TaxID=53468 RepID=A0A5K3EVV0_MESCO